MSIKEPLVVEKHLTPNESYIIIDTGNPQLIKVTGKMEQIDRAEYQALIGRKESVMEARQTLDSPLSLILIILITILTTGWYLTWIANRG